MIGDYVRTRFNGFCKIVKIDKDYFITEMKGNCLPLYIRKDKYEVIPKQLMETKIGQLLWHKPA